MEPLGQKIVANAECGVRSVHGRDRRSRRQVQEDA